jgi:hypothetical protein
MQTAKTGNAHRPSKFVRFRRTYKVMAKKFGKESPQVNHFLSSRPGWAAKVVKV